MDGAVTRIDETLKVGNQKRICVLGLSPPEPNESVALERRIGPQSNARRERAVGIVNASTGRVELQSVIGALQIPRIEHFAPRKRREAVGADPRQGGHRAIRAAKEHELLPAYDPLERLTTEFIDPR
jgi:hypothetical protein